MVSDYFPRHDRDNGSLNVAVLFGGPSNEHDISVSSGRAVAAALLEAGCEVDEIGFDDAVLPELEDGINVVFPVLHGRFGEDGGIQGLIDETGIAYVGSDRAGSHTIINKDASKKVLADNGMLVPDGILLGPRSKAFPKHLDLPLVVKPNREGSTIGFSLIHDEREWPAALASARAYDDDVVVEEFIPGTELTVGLLNGHALPVMEIQPPGDVFDYDAKYIYEKGETTYLCPPKHITKAVQKEAQRVSVLAYQVLGARDLLRVDMRLSADGESVFILEANSMPGFTSTSLVPKSAAAVGITFPDLCAGLAHLALDRT